MDKVFVDEAVTVASTDTDPTMEPIVKDPDESKARNMRAFRYRLALVAIFCIWLWGSSPEAAQNLVERVIGRNSPEFSDANETWANANYRIGRIDEMGLIATEVKYDQCIEKLEWNAHAMSRETKATHAANQVLLDRRVSEQVADLNEIISLHGTIQSLGESIPLRNVSTCSPEDRERAEAWIGRDALSAREEAKRLSLAREQRIKMSSGNLLEYIKIRGNYDYEYIKNKTGLANLALGNIDGFNGFDISDIFEDLREALLSTVFCDSSSENGCSFDVLYRAIDKFSLEANGLQAFYREQLAAAGDIIERMERRIDWLSGALRDYIDFYRRVIAIYPNIPNVLGVDNAFLSSIDPSDLFPGIYFVGRGFTIPDIQDFTLVIRSLETFQLGLVGEINDLLRTATAASLARINLSIDSFTANISLALSLEDYDPPQYRGSSPEITTPEDEVESITAEGREYLDEISEAVDTIQSTDTGLSVNISTIDAPVFNSTTFSSTFDPTRSGYEKFEQVQFYFGGLGVIVAFLWKHQKWLVRLYNVIAMYATTRRYWDKTSIGLPVIYDAEVDEKEDTAESQPKSPLRRLLVLVQSGPPPIAFLFIIGVTLISLTVMVYVELYGGYYRGCVAERAGLQLSENVVIPYFVNKASRRTNQAKDQLPNTFALEVQQTCYMSLYDSEQKKSFNFLDVRHLENEASYIREQSVPVETCFDFQAAGLEFDGLPERPPLRLLDQTFDCEELPQQCLLSHDGYREYAEDLGLEVSCNLVWTAHVYVWRYLLLFLVSFAFVASRKFKESGLKRIHWRALSGEDGPALQISSSKFFNSAPHRQVIRKKVKRAIYLFEMGGWLLLVFGQLLSISCRIGLYLILNQGYLLRPVWYQ